MDRNTVIGFVLLGVLLFVYLFTSTKATHELEAQRKLQADSTARVASMKDSIERLHAKDSVVLTGKKPDTATGINRAFAGVERLTTIENEVIKLVFSNKGGQPVAVTLKQYKSWDSNAVKLITPGTDNRLMYNISTGQNATSNVADLYFDSAQVVRNADGSQTISYKLPTQAGESLVHSYTIRPNDYLVDWNVEIGNPAALFYQNNFALSWRTQLNKTQQDVRYERRQGNIGFWEDGKFDYMVAKTERELDKPVKWVSVSQQFFNITLIGKSPFATGTLHMAKETSDSNDVVERAQVDLQAKIPSLASTAVQMQLYYGPNDFNILDHQAEGMTRIIDLGRGMYSFVRPINVYVIMPVFNFFKSHIASFGVVILLLTLFIRLFTSPLVYSSYLSGAKMKALRPEIEAMKKRVGDDKQQQGMEQMKLFREAGVNPLGGCIPALLQIPIFFALYSFFNTYMGLRGQGFLWSHDLSSYDSILHLSFSLPLGFGDHVSLFALTACTSSFLISLYGMSMTPDQSNPAMKYMPYVMPIFLLFFFNSLPSALTWYYTVSNTVTLSLQLVIQRYIIDHDKILADLQEKRKKPKTKSKWQERLDQMQEAQKQAQKKSPNTRK